MTTVVLFDMTRAPSTKLPDTDIITGRVVRNGDLTDVLQIIMASPDEVQVTPLVQDLITEKFVPANRESAASKRIRRAG